MDRQRIGLWGTVLFAGAAVVGIMVQLYLIGGVAFGEGAGWLDAHKDFGKAVHLAYILTFLSALLAAWPNWRATLWPFVLAVIGSVQAFLAGGGNFASGDNGAVHGFHAALVPVVVVLALWIGWRAWTAIQESASTGTTPAT